MPDQQFRDQHETLTAESVKTRDDFIIVLSLPIQYLILSWLASIKVRATIILLRYKANNTSPPASHNVHVFMVMMDCMVERKQVYQPLKRNGYLRQVGQGGES